MKPVTIVLLSAMLGGCNMITLSSDGKAQTTVVPPPQSDFISIEGERYEKYYFTIDPATWDRQLNISGSYSPPIGSWRNSITFNNVPLRYFFVNGSYPVRGTGTVTYRNTISGATNDRSFNTTRTMPFENEENYKSTIRQDYSVLNTFENQSFVLPKTSDYENSYHLSKYITLTYNCTFAQFAAFAEPDLGTNQEVVTFAGNIPMSTTLFDSFVCVSRDFYQYKSLVIQFDPALVVHGFSPTLPTIISSFDLSEENVLTVTFAEYDDPFVGPLFSYLVETGDNVWEEKTFSIE